MNNLLSHSHVTLNEIFKETPLEKITDEWQIIKYYYDNYRPFMIGIKNNYRPVERNELMTTNMLKLFLYFAEINHLSNFCVKINNYFTSHMTYSSTTNEIIETKIGIHKYAEYNIKYPALQLNVLSDL